LTLIIIAGFFEIARWNNAQIAGKLSIEICLLCLLTKTGGVCYTGISAARNCGRRAKSQ
jgi:hypothetical protein